MSVRMRASVLRPRRRMMQLDMIEELQLIESQSLVSDVQWTA